MSHTRTRPVTTFTYNVPQKLQPELDGIKSITLRELTAQDELMATKRSGGDPIALAYELAKQSLCAVDGVDVKIFDETIDVAMGRLGPKGRALLLTAYTKIHAPSMDDTADFLSSVETEVKSQ